MYMITKTVSEVDWTISV